VERRFGLVRRIEAYIENHDGRARPFVRVVTADSIFEKLQRLTARICGT